MKLDNLLPAIAIVISAGVIALVAAMHVNNLKGFNDKQARDMAVDGCMQNARYQWQEKNQKDSTLLNTTDEPNRYWYKLCMEEKGYEVHIEL